MPLAVVPLVHSLVAPYVPFGESKLIHMVILRIFEGLWNGGHLVVMDNYFSSIKIFKFLLKDFYASNTMRSNRIGLLVNLKNI
jgi:hypothetical protein